MEDTKIINNRIAEFRKKAGYKTQGELIDALNKRFDWGIKQQSVISHWEKGGGYPPLDKAIGLAKLLGTSVYELWHWDKPPDGLEGLDKLSVEQLTNIVRPLLSENSLLKSENETLKKDIDKVKKIIMGMP